MKNLENISTEASTRGDTRERILNNARNLFFEEGFSNISTDRLCKEASVSKTSIYRHFGDMMGVFIEVIQRESKDFSLKQDIEFNTKEEFINVLSSFGEILLGFLNSKEILQFNRLMHTEHKLDKTMTQRFYDNAYQLGHNDMTKLIEQAKEKKIISSTVQSAELADYLVSMWEGLPYVRARLSLTDKPFPNPKKRARDCVEIMFG